MPEKLNALTDLTKGKNSLLSRQQIPSSDDNHQLEFVAEINGVSYINDSKSIRLTATRNSLEQINSSVVLIIGGKEDDNDYSILAKQIKEKVVSIIYLGNNNDLIFQHYSKHYMLFAKASTINEAVQIASAYATPGSLVLFSPACESINYKNRGNEFKDVVKKLSAK